MWVSTVPASAALGILISSAVALLIVNSFTEETLLAWGWRTGYWLGTLFCLISIMLRITMPETPYFQRQSNMPHKRYPIATLFKDVDTLKSLLIVIGLASSWGIIYQILFVWMPTYLTHVQQFSNTIALQINSIFMFCFACLLLFVGYIADKVNRQLLLKIASIAMLLLAYPLFTMLSSGSLTQIYIAMGLFTLIFSIYLPTAFVCMIELFKTEIRYTGLSFGFNVGLAIFGGTCPLIVTWLIAITKNNTSPALYMLFAAICALITSSFITGKSSHGNGSI